MQQTITLRQAIDDALSKVGILSVGWVVVIGEIELDGTETLVCEDSEGLLSWARTGMLTEALESDSWDEEEPDA